MKNARALLSSHCYFGVVDSTLFFSLGFDDWRLSWKRERDKAGDGAWVAYNQHPYLQLQGIRYPPLTSQALSMHVVPTHICKQNTATHKIFKKINKRGPRERKPVPRNFRTGFNLVYTLLTVTGLMPMEMLNCPPGYLGQKKLNHRLHQRLIIL